MDAGAPDLATLLQPVSVADFVGEHWDRAPMVVHARDGGGPDRFAHILTPDTVDRLVSEGGLRDGAVRLTRGAEVAGGWSVPALAWGPGHVRDYARPERVFDLMRAGWTLTLPRAEQADAAVGAVCRMLREAFGAHATAAVVRAPVGAPAGVHRYDTTNQFVLQCAGSQRWRVFAAHIHQPLPDEACPADGVAPGPLVLDVRLEAGDLLFIPRGFVFRASGLDHTRSLHVSVGVRPTTWNDVVQAVVTQLREGAGEPGDTPFRVDTRGAVALSEEQEDHVDEAVENTLLDVDLEELVQALGRRMAGTNTHAPLSAALHTTEDAP